MPHKPPDLGPAKTRAAPTDPFDIWLSRGLHSLYSAVTAEPIPPELLRLIDGLPEKAVARATGPPSSPRDLGGAMAQGCSTLCGSRGESSLPQVGGEQRRRGDDGIPGSPNL
jgi:hypothetical protein